MTETKELSLEQLKDIRDTLTERIRAGLAGPDQEVLALPAYLRPPSPELAGQALVVDAGGTNMRAAWLKLGEQVEIAAGPLAGTLPDGREREVDREEFFASQAALVQRLGAPSGLPLGYCFSYPAEVLPSGDARLLRWTKAIQVGGVVDTLVGQGLARAIGQVSQVKVLNDTVAALMGGAFAGRGRHRNFIGLIVGTGTNMACFINQNHIPKLGSERLNQEMAVNLESGNYSPPHLGPWDEAVDKATLDPGRGRFEKAASGFYLPYIMERLCPDLAGFDPRSGTGQLVKIRQAGPDAGAEAFRAASYLLDRSADMVAAALAGLFPFFSAGSVGLQAEGGLFWGAPGYSQRVEDALHKLLPQGQEFAILRQDNVNLVGAACAALT